MPSQDAKGTGAGEQRSWPLHGWDDEKVYLWSEEHGELCVSDEPELMRTLLQVCRDYYARRGVPKVK